MKRIITDERQRDLFYESPKAVIKRLESLSSKIAHNHPLIPREIDELSKILEGNPNAETIIRRLQAQNTNRRSYALTIEERELAAQAINMTIATVREELARVLKK